MGLDMYLKRKIYVGKYSGVKGTISLKVNNEKLPISKTNIKYVEQEVGYWRKANQIHKWFVDNVQDGKDDCGTYYVSIEKLKELLGLCKEVKEKAIMKKGKIPNGERWKDGKWEIIYEDGEYIENTEEIAEILPTESGFFFGSTEYNKYYMYDIDETIKIIEEQLKLEEELRQKGVDTYLEYHSSW